MHEGTNQVTYWVVASTIIHFLAFLAVVLHALQRRRNASATILWIFTAWSFPFIGPLLYLSFGVDRVSLKGRATRAANRLMEQQRTRLHKDQPLASRGHLEFRVDANALKNRGSRRLNLSIDVLNPEHPLLAGNHITPLLCGDEAYPRMLEAIRSARHHIHLQSFIIYPDQTGRLFLDELQKKAESGVKVRLLFDTFGSTHAYLGGVFRKYARTPNFEIHGWTQANPLKRQFQINLRNHRKNLVVDGKTAFFGGVNLAGENSSTDQKPAIRDYHFKVEGPLVHEFQYAFLLDWYFMTNQPIETLLNHTHFPAAPKAGTARARIINSGPSEPRGIASETFFNAIVLAEKQIQIVTPYFVPTIDILKALRSAARRGVDVCLVVPEKNNHISAGMASRALFEELLESGIRIFLRQPPFIHAKAMLIDDERALVGTANLDVRSLELNYETMVLLEAPDALSALKQMILEDMACSRELNLNQWLQRPGISKLAENLCSLMTPVL